MRFQTKLLTANLEIASIKNVHVKRLPTQYKNPLPKIELPICPTLTVEEIWPFDVLLNDLLLWFLFVRQYFLQIS
jgi:hypothetical protein